MLPGCYQNIMALYTRIPQFNWFGLFHLFFYVSINVMLVVHYWSREQDTFKQKQNCQIQLPRWRTGLLTVPRIKTKPWRTNFGSKWTTYLQLTEWKNLLPVSVLVNQGPRIVPLLIKLDPGLLVKSFTGLQLHCNVSFSCGSILVILSSI